MITFSGNETCTAPTPTVYTVMQTTVPQKGGHTVAIQYAGAKNVTFTLKGWNLAVQAYPERPETAPVEATKISHLCRGASNART